MGNKKKIERFKKNVKTLLLEDIHSIKYINSKIHEIDNESDGKNFHSKMLEAFVHYSFQEDEAENHWNNIFKNYQDLKSRLSRDIGLRVAIFDYFINLNKILSNPILVEIHLLMETERLAMMDSLTGLFNRRYFDLALKKEIRRSSRYNKDFSIIMLDIDDFKMINDTHGHLYGDTILRTLGYLLSQSSREEDVICRYGGEEFVIILPETTSNGALNYIERFRISLKENKKFKENRISISGGISSYPYDGKSSKKLLNIADKALYKAKYSGKDCIVINDSNDNRKHPRFHKSWKVEYQLIEKVFNESDRTEVFTTNISLGGVSFESEREFSLDTKLLLNLELPNNDKIIVMGAIVWIKRVDEKIYNYGIQFFDIDLKQLNKMKGLLLQDKNNSFIPSHEH